MAAEEKRMDIIGQNSNDGWHCGNTAQQVVKCSCIGCDNESTHTWSGHPTCDDCGTPSRSEVRNVVNHTLLHPRNPEIIAPSLDGFSVGYKVTRAEDNPIFTQAMADAGELPPVGSMCMSEYPEGVWNEVKYMGKGISGLHVLSYLNGSVDQLGSLIKFKPLDTRTDREKMHEQIHSIMTDDSGRFMKFSELPDYTIESYDKLIDTF
jgi:hypothetical protein